ncbi:MAG: MMPL family transporter [Acidimicrobiia bacterium]|nr:MMPL family transporter [Acidimicrobiia bacterium]
MRTSPHQSIFTRLGHAIVRRRRRILVGSVLGLVVAAVVGVGVFPRLQTGGFDEDSAESVRARELLEDEFGTGSPSVVFLATAEPGATVDSAQVVADGLAFTEALVARGDLEDVVSYWSLGSAPPLRSDDGTRALVLARIPGDEDTNPEWSATLADLGADHTGAQGTLEVELGGPAELFERVGATIEADLARAEAIAIPITLLLLIGVFGGIVAALLPLGVGVMAIFGAFFVLYVTTGFTDVSIFSLNLVTAMGLGLAIDYSLFVVSRYREELAAGRTVDGAVVRTVETAGRTVAFSALTVAVSLMALLVFPLYFLRSFAYAGIGVLLVAMVASVVTLPAVLAVLGTRVDKLQLWQRTPTPVGEGFWHRMAVTVMKRPVVVSVVVITFLVLLGLPFLRVAWGTPDHRVLPDGDPAREVSEIIRDDFDSNESAAFPVVVRGDVDDVTTDAFATTLSSLDDVARVDATTGRYIGGTMVVGPDATAARHAGNDVTWFNVVPTVEPISVEGEAMVHEIRDLDSGFGETLVGGESASLIDTKEAIFSRVPLAALWIGASTFVLLFLMFGSLLVPAKAIVLNLLSLTATFGAMIWVFQNGNGSGLLGFTATGLTDVTTPILMFCIAFGLSMDYEVFLLSRIKEDYDRTGDNDLAVAMGLERTGRIVTAAALLLAVTFFAFATSQITFIKLFGLGLGMAVLVDASIVRATLVPALMKLAGDANWWLPDWLRRIHDRIGISEGETDDVAVEWVDVTDDPEPSEAELAELRQEVRTLARSLS